MSLLSFFGLFSWPFFELILVFLVLPSLAKQRLLEGNVSQMKWFSTQCAIESKEECIRAPELGIVITKEEEEVRLKTLQLHSEKGWRSWKVTSMVIYVVFTTLLGILNYPFALLAGLCCFPYVLIVPRQECSSIVSILGDILLMVSSPSILACCLLFGYNTSPIPMEYIFTQSSFGLLFLCCGYFPMHTLSVSIWRSKKQS